MKKQINELQINAMIRFMERNGDLRMFGDVRQRVRIRRKWVELVGILNNLGEKKTMAKWSKVWSDTKYNVLKKYKKITRGIGGNLTLTENEMIIIKVLKTPPVHPGLIEETLQASHPLITNSICDSEVKEEVVRENDISTEELPDTVTEDFYVIPTETESEEKRQDSIASCSSSTPASPTAESFSIQDNSSKDRRKSTDSVDKMSEIADKFYELERERERMAHEREMARIQQHNEFLSIMSRLVNVVESLAPSFKRYMDRSMNGGA